MSDTSETIRNMRKKQKMTQKRLAELVGIHKVYMTQIESGKQKPSKALLDKIMSVLDGRD